MTYIIGLDLGQAHDRTALAVAERREAERVWGFRHLEQFPLGTSYPEVVERVQLLLRKPPLHGNGQLVIDATGVGRPVFDIFRRAGCRVVGVLIHGGNDVVRDPALSGFRVPKRDLVSTVQILLQQQRLKISPSLPAAEVLLREMQNFRVRISTDTAHDSYGAWREGEHDDLVLAVALACWFGQRYRPLPTGPTEKEFFQSFAATQNTTETNPDQFPIADYRPWGDVRSPGEVVISPGLRSLTFRR